MTTKHYTKVSQDEWPCRYFKPREIACKGSGLVMLTPASLAALRKLDALREVMGQPLKVNSGYRSPAHNARVGGAKASKHMEGIAFDISMVGVDPHRFEAEAKRLGFTGIGLYPPQKPSGAKNFIHIDTRAGSWRGSEWGEFPRKPAAKQPASAPVAAPKPASDLSEKTLGQDNTKQTGLWAALLRALVALFTKGR